MRLDSHCLNMQAMLLKHLMRLYLWETICYIFYIKLYQNISIFINRLFVGAPKGNHTRPSRNQLLHLDEPGVVYQCKLPGPCIEIEPAVTENEIIYLRQLHLHGKIKKKHSWLGAAMSIERNSDTLTVRERFWKIDWSVGWSSINYLLYCRYVRHER